MAMTPHGALERIGLACVEAMLCTLIATGVSAGLVAQLGWQKIQAGQTVTSIALEANYLHRTDTELFPKPK